MKRRMLGLLKILVSAGLVGFLLSRVDLAEVGATLARTDPKLALAALAVAHADRALQGGKWWLLLRAAGARFSLGAAIANTYAGNFAGMFLPSGVGGDFVRIALLRTSGIAMSEVVASIVVERVFGILALFLTAAGATLLARWFGIPVPEKLDLLALTLLLAMLVAIALSFRLGVEGRLRWVTRIGARFRLGDRLASLTDAYRRYGKRKIAVLTYLVLSVAEVMMMVGVITLVAWSLGGHIPLLSMAILVPITLFIQRMPISINGLGVQESVLAAFLVSFGWDLNEAIALGVGLRVLELFTLLPGAFLWMGQRRADTPGATDGTETTPDGPR